MPLIGDDGLKKIEVLGFHELSLTAISDNGITVSVDPPRRSDRQGATRPLCGVTRPRLGQL